MSKVHFSHPDRNFSCVDEDNCAQDNATNEDNNASKVFKNKLVKKEMELKLVAEIKERADQKHNKHLKDSPPIESILAVSGISHDPVSQLGECGNRENYYTGCLAMKNQTEVHFFFEQLETRCQLSYFSSKVSRLASTCFTFV